MESVYSSSSSKFSTSAVHGRKLGGRQATMVSSGASEVRQRILSARLLRVKHLQNQLAVAQQQVFELSQENRGLKTMIRRQENALLKYDGANAELPQLLNSHAEEIRAWHSKYRELQRQNKDLLAKLKQKEQVILTISDENKHFHQLNRDRHLDEREKLSNRVKELEARVAEKDNDTKLLARKLQLEAKCFRNQMHQESLKYRDVCQKLDKATSEVTRLSTRLEVGERRMNGGAFLVRGFHQKNFLLRESHSAHFSTSLAPINHFRASGSSSACSKSPEEATPHRLEKLPTTEVDNEARTRKNAKRDIQKVREILKAESSERSTTKSVSSADSAENLNGEELPEESVQETCTNVDVYKVGEENTAPDVDLSRKFERLSSKDDVKINEAILDEICESVMKNGFEESQEKLPAPPTVTFQKVKNQPSKRQNIDQRKKTKLLAALKAIDANESFDS